MKILVCDADTDVRNVVGAALPGQTVVYEDGPLSDEIIATHPDTEILSLFVSSSLSAERIDVLPNLKCIAARSTGTDHIDVAHARERNVVVSSVPKYGAHTVAEFVFALLLSLSRRIPEATRQVRDEGNFDTHAFEGFELFGKTIGVVGTGAIGRNVVSIARGFGMNVLMYDRSPDLALVSDGAKYCEMSELLGGSDIVSLHVPATPENTHMLSRAEFEQMKQGAYLINTARGELVDTEALLEVLRSGKIAGAGLDVLEEERVLKDEMELVKGIESIHTLKTLVRDHALIDMPQVLITPHIAFFSREAYHEILATTAENIKAFLSGAPKNVVSV